MPTTTSLTVDRSDNLNDFDVVSSGPQNVLTLELTNNYSVASQINDIEFSSRTSIADPVNLILSGSGFSFTGLEVVLTGSGSTSRVIDGISGFTIDPGKPWKSILPPIYRI